MSHIVEARTAIQNPDRPHHSIDKEYNTHASFTTYIAF